MLLKRPTVGVLMCVVPVDEGLISRWVQLNRTVIAVQLLRLHRLVYANCLRFVEVCLTLTAGHLFCRKMFFID